MAQRKRDILQQPPLASKFYGYISKERIVISTLKEQGALLSKNKELQAIITSLSKNYSELQRRYESLLNATSRSTLKDPTWEELKSFIESDKTDELEYKPHEFDCTGFAITLRDNAWRQGLRCGFVEIDLSSGVGHNLNAFKTTDRGLVFVDCLDKDAIAYVQVGKPYGKIALKNVKSRYIDCSGDPKRFWGPLNYTTHPIHHHSAIATTRSIRDALNFMKKALRPTMKP